MNELSQAKALKQTLIDFVLDAEGELATALETYSAQQLTQSQTLDFHRREFVVDRFAVEATVGDRSILDWFIQEHPDLSSADRDLLQRWRRSLIGLFAITQLTASGWVVMNWTTAKFYAVQLTEAEQQTAQRLQVGDIVLMQLAPLSTDWFCFGNWISLGRLGKPKLAVAIGNFKNNYPDHLYSDAPELLAEAWKSVERYHQNFIDFFGANEVTLSGYQLGKRLAEFQESMLQKQLAEAGLDQNKSLAELVQEVEISEAELAETAAALGADAKLVRQALNSPKQATKMVTPTIELPPALKKAEQVTVLTDPREGQVFLMDYVTFKTILESGPSFDDLHDSKPHDVKLVNKYLEKPDVPAFVWHRLAQQYPESLEALLQSVLKRPDFRLANDLETLLRQSGKNLQTQLPEIASVPIHLHELFQEAVMEVSKDRVKKKPKAKSGFQR